MSDIDILIASEHGLKSNEIGTIKYLNYNISALLTILDKAGNQVE
jgi:hypothetical protein